MLACLLAVPAVLRADPHDYEYGTAAYDEEVHRQAAAEKVAANNLRVNAPKPIDLSEPAPRASALMSQQQLDDERRMREQQVAIAHQILAAGTPQNFIERNTALANQGDAAACWNLSQVYLYAREGAGKDVGKAVFWLEKAAQLGDATAMRWLAGYYQNAYPDVFGPVTPDPAKAAAWYRAAGSAGDVEAMRALAYIYRYGQGVDRDIAEAKRWFKAAADAGNIVALDEFLDLEIATGTTKDAKEARRLREEAKQMRAMLSSPTEIYEIQ